MALGIHGTNAYGIFPFIWDTGPTFKECCVDQYQGEWKDVYAH